MPLVFMDEYLAIQLFLVSSLKQEKGKGEKLRSSLENMMMPRFKHYKCMRQDLYKVQDNAHQYNLDKTVEVKRIKYRHSVSMFTYLASKEQDDFKLKNLSLIFTD